MEQEIKSIEERVKEKQADNLMNFIIAKTFSRHSKLTEEEYLKEIGFAGSGKTEDEATRIAMFNILVESTKQLLQAEKGIETIGRTLKFILGE